MPPRPQYHNHLPQSVGWCKSSTEVDGLNKTQRFDSKLPEINTNLSQETTQILPGIQNQKCLKQQFAFETLKRAISFGIK